MSTKRKRFAQMFFFNFWKSYLPKIVASPHMSQACERLLFQIDIFLLKVHLWKSYTCIYLPGEHCIPEHLYFSRIVALNYMSLGFTAKRIWIYPKGETRKVKACFSWLWWPIRFNSQTHTQTMNGWITFPLISIYEKYTTKSVISMT